MLKILFFFLGNSSEEMKREREEKKRYLLRKLSFRPSVDELKNRKVCIAMQKLIFFFLNWGQNFRFWYLSSRIYDFIVRLVNRGQDSGKFQIEIKVLFLDMRRFFLESKIYCTNPSMKSISVKETSSCNKGFFQSFPYTIL